MPTNKKRKGNKKKQSQQQHAAPNSGGGQPKKAPNETKGEPTHQRGLAASPKPAVEEEISRPQEEPSLTEQQERQDRLERMANGVSAITPRRLAMVFPDLEDRMHRKREKMAYLTLEVYEVVIGASNWFDASKDRDVDKAQNIANAFAKAAAPGSTEEAMVLQGILSHVVHRIYNKFDAASKLMVDTLNKNGQSNRIKDPSLGLLLLDNLEILQSEIFKAVLEFRVDIVRICFDDDETKFQSSWETLETRHTMGELEECPEGLAPFWEIVDNSIWRRRKLFSNLEEAIEGIRLGVHEAPEMTCWQCSQPTWTSRRNCRGCNVAFYCSKRCRRAHAVVHQPICKDVRELFELLKDGLSDVLEAHKYPEHHKSMYGIQPSSNDCFLACLGITLAYSKGLGPLFDLQGPSMKNFYRNAHHVVYHGFWFHPPPVESVVLTQATTKSEDSPTTWQFTWVVIAMMFDYRGPDGMLQWELFRDVIQVVGDDYTTTIASLTPSKWLGLYPAGVWNVEHLRRWYQTQMFECLRNESTTRNLTESASASDEASGGN